MGIKLNVDLEEAYFEYDFRTWQVSHWQDDKLFCISEDGEEVEFDPDTVRPLVESYDVEEEAKFSKRNSYD